MIVTMQRHGATTRRRCARSGSAGSRPLPCSVAHRRCDGLHYVAAAGAGADRDRRHPAWRRGKASPGSLRRPASRSPCAMWCPTRASPVMSANGRATCPTRSSASRCSTDDGDVAAVVSILDRRRAGGSAATPAARRCSNGVRRGRRRAAVPVRATDGAAWREATARARSTLPTDRARALRCDRHVLDAMER